MSLSLSEIQDLQEAALRLPLSQGDPTRPSEFTEFGSTEPIAILKKFVESSQKFTPAQISEIEDLVEQVSLPEPLMKISQAKFEEDPKKKQELHHIQEFFYDPSAGHNSGTFFLISRMPMKVNQYF